MTREEAMQRASKIFDSENLNDGMLIAPGLIGDLIEDIYKDFYTLKDLINNEVGNPWFQEYGGGNYRCKFCWSDGEHEKDCFVIKTQGLL